jgi:hypothetical protein
VSLLKILFGANAFEINDIQEHETGPRESGDCNVTLPGRLATVSIRQTRLVLGTNRVKKNAVYKGFGIGDGDRKF